MASLLMVHTHTIVCDYHYCVSRIGKSDIFPPHGIKGIKSDNDAKTANGLWSVVIYDIKA